MRRNLAVTAAVVVGALPPSAFGATVSVDVTGGVTYTAAPGEVNVVEVGESGGTVTITDSGAIISAGAGCNQVSDHEATCSGVTHDDIHLGDLGDTATLVAQESVFFTLTGGGGGDDLTLCASCHGLLVGGSGADTLQGGDVGAALWGSEGPDSLTGGAYYDGIRGGLGNDTIDAGGKDDDIAPGGGKDVVDGGAGDDSVAFRVWKRRVVVDLRLGTATGQGPKTLVSIEDVVATNGADRLYGDGGSNALNGLGGDDLLLGQAGRDFLCGCGGGGSDRLLGGPGIDQLVAYGGKDVLLGGPGSDVLRPGEGRDSAFGQAGNDDFHAKDGMQDLLFGGRGTDIGWLDRRLDITTSIRRVPTR